MKKATDKKLSLHRESLCLLITQDALRPVQGGTGGTATFSSWPTNPGTFCGRNPDTE